MCVFASIFPYFLYSYFLLYTYTQILQQFIFMHCSSLLKLLANAMFLRVSLKPNQVYANVLLHV